MKKQEFIEKLSSLIKEYEKTGKEEIELNFAFFNDDLNKKYYWEDKGFEYRENIDVFFNDRNYDEEINFLIKNNNDWIKTRKYKIGLKIIDDV